MSDESSTEIADQIVAGTDSEKRDASYSLDDESLSGEEEKDFARSMGFGEEGNQPSPSAEVSPAAEAAKEPSSEPTEALSPEPVIAAEEAGSDQEDQGEWENIAPRSDAEGTQEPIEAAAQAITGEIPVPAGERCSESPLRTETTELERQLSERNLELERLRGSLEQEIKEQASQQKRLEGFESELETLSSERDAVVNELATRSGELGRAREQIEQLSASLRKARTTLVPLPAGEQALRTEVLGLRARVSQSNQESTAATARAEALQTDLAIAEARIDEREHERDLIEAERQLLASQLGEIERENEVLTERHRTTLGLCDKLQAENQELRSTQIALEETLEARDLEISAREEHLAVTREGISYRDEQLLALSEEQEMLRRANTQLESEQLQHAQQRQALEDKVGLREERIAVLTETLSEIESALGRKPKPAAARIETDAEADPSPGSEESEGRRSSPDQAVP